MKILILAASALTVSVGLSQQVEIKTDKVTKYAAAETVALNPSGSSLSHHIYSGSTDPVEIAKALKMVPIVNLPQADKHPTWTWSQWFRNQSQ